MQNLTKLATVVALALGLAACGGGGSGGASSNANANQNGGANFNPINPQNKTKYDMDFIDPQTGLEDVITLSASNERNPVIKEGKESSISAKYNPVAAYGQLPEFKYNLKNGNKIIATAHKAKVESLDAHFAGQMVAILGSNKNEITRRNVVFELKDKYISGHSTKKDKDDVQVIFEKTLVAERNSQPHYAGVGFNGDAKIVKGRTEENARYFGSFFGTGTDVKGIVGEFKGSQDNHQGVFYAEKE